MEHHFFVLKKGQEITSEIIKFCEEKDIRAAYVSALGAISEAEISYYDMRSKEYLNQKFNQDLEITNITGNVAVLDEKLVLHAHATFSDADYKTVGGHLNSAVVSGTCEVFLVPLKKGLARKHDGDTGLNLIS